jgi:iron complex outermembrane receptor protein
MSLGAAAEPLTMPPLVVTAPAERPGGGTAALATITPLEPETASLADLFRRVPGLSAQDSFGGFDPPRLAVRGSGIQSAPTNRGLSISFLGMPLNAADGSFNLALLESQWIDSAGLIRGPAAGVPALGGSLALGDAFAAGNSIGMSYGSDQSATVSARGACFRENRALAGRAAGSRSDGWRPHSEQERASVFAAARTALGGDSDLTIRFLGSRPRYEVPGPLTKRDALENPTASVAAVERDRPFRETGYAHLAASASTRRASGHASLTLGGVHQRDEFRQLMPNGISITDADEAYVAFHGAKDWQTSGQQTRVAALLQSGWWDASRYRNAGGETGALIGEQRLRPLTLSASLDHQLPLGAKQHLEFGGSVLTARRDIDDRFDPVPGSVPVDLGFSGTRLAPRAAWSWSPFREAGFVASWARSYEPPTYNDLLFTDGPAAARILRSAPLDWQRTDSWEIGARGRHGGFSWSSNVYYAPWRNEFLRLVDENGSPRGTVNAGRTIHTGWETSIEWDLLPGSGDDLVLWSSYNLTDARFDDDAVYGNRHIAGVPPHSGALGLRAMTDDGWFVAPGFQWQAGETYGDHFNTVGYGGYGLWSLELGRRHPDGWSVTLGIHNLFDRRTIASTAGVLDRAPDPANTAIFLPASGRSVELRFEYLW